MKEIFAGLVAVPVLAFFGGVGFLAHRIGQTWDSRATEAMIAGLTATCGAGAVILALVLGLIVGIPYASRIWREGQQQTAQHWQALPSPRSAAWQQQPPQIVDGRRPAIGDHEAGQWVSQGAGQYDLWEAEASEDGLQPTRGDRWG